MTLVNKKVENNTFGLGVITDIKEQKIWVKFQDEIGTKMFEYPEAFEKFLKVMDPAVEDYIWEELRIKQEKMELDLREKQRIDAETEEEKKRMAAADKKAAAKAAKKK